ncbi:hypothetical protein TR51_19915 [Kitasatospora griseola]|uniref:Lipoprotein n=1 Tax=Kitasatospora griseola TaxID=2064 RepID=A0A0D0PM86_KITGR|nr:hypothetical protein [Kitasatospora griseola]KIQ61602.1 hypothetical protein TR51_19915 [Kitasatospora griseola]
MSGRLAAALAAAAFAATGCTATGHPGPATGPAAHAAPADTAGPGPACSAAPSPTLSMEGSWAGSWRGPLPAEIRCLPHVADGTLAHMAGEMVVDGKEWNAVEVRVADGTTPDQARALCHRLTDLGYGLGGSHDITLLAVSGAGHYVSEPGGDPACFDGDRSTLRPALP